MQSMDNLYEMIQKTDSGDVEAQYRVAYYIVWENMKDDMHDDWLERALSYFKLAAAQGYTDSMLDLAAMYNVGQRCSARYGLSYLLVEESSGLSLPECVYFSWRL